MKLTDRQTAVLAYLRKHDPERDSPLTGAEIAEAIWGAGVFTSLEQGARTCKQLAAKGLAVALGTSESGGRCYVAAPPPVRIEWKISHGSGSGKWYPEADREFLNYWVKMLNRDYGPGTHWIAEHRLTDAMKRPPYGRMIGCHSQT